MDTWAFTGEQNLDRNGKYVLELMEKWNLTQLDDDDERCEGEITREQRGEKV